MATKLNKPVHRQANRVMATKTGRIEMPDKVGFVPCGAREVVVTLLPSDEIMFRVKGTRTTYSIHIATAMSIAQAVTFYEEWKRKNEHYQLKKKAGYKRMRRPRRPSHPGAASMLRRLYAMVN